MIRYRPNRRRYFITTAATYELLRQAAAGASGLIPSLQLTASSSGRLLVSLVDDVANQPAVLAALAPLLSEGAVQEVTEVEWNAAVASAAATGGGVSSWNDLTDKPTSFAPSAHKGTHATGGADALTPADIGAASASHAHTAADITSGTIDPARLGSGTANSTTFLRGDGTWAAAGSTNASDLTSGTLANARLTTRIRASANLYLWSSFR